MDKSFWFTILQISLPLVVAAFGYLGRLLSVYIDKRIKNQALANVLIRVNDAVVTAVKCTEQQVVKKLKDASADGVITDDEKKEIKLAAFGSIVKYLGEQGIEEAKKVFNLDDAGVHKMLNDKVEAAVLDVKKN